MSFEIRGKLNGIKYPCFAEIKYDGEYCEYRKNMLAGSRLVNKYGNERKDCPIIWELDAQQMSYVIMGELYYGEQN